MTTFRFLTGPSAPGRLLLAAGFAASATLFASLPADACTCGDRLKGAKALEASGIASVFEGQLLSVTDVEDRVWATEANVAVPTVRFDYAVKRWWKKDPGARVSVFAVKGRYQGCSASLPAAGTTYLVYAGTDPKVAPYVDDACSATKASSSGGGELAELGAGQSPSPVAEPPPPEEGGCAIAGGPGGSGLAGAGGLFGLASIGLLVRRRRRR